MKKATFFTPNLSLERGERLDKRNCPQLTHSCLISPNNKIYELMGTLNAEESAQLEQQTGLQKLGKVILGRGSFGWVRLVRNNEGKYLGIKKMKQSFSQHQFNCKGIAQFENNLIWSLQGIEGILIPTEIFVAEDHLGKETIISIMPLANLGDAENLVKILYETSEKQRVFSPSVQDWLLNNNYPANPVKINGSIKSESEKTEGPVFNQVPEYEMPENLVKIFSDYNEDSAPVVQKTNDPWIEKQSQTEVFLSFQQNLQLKVNNWLLIYVARELTKTLCQLHKRGIYHRDIQLKNLLLTTEGDVFLSDFGCAIHYSGENYHKSSVLSKPIAPELYSKKADIYHVTSSCGIDQWRLGMLLLGFLPGSNSLDYILKNAKPGNVTYWGGELHFPTEIPLFLEMLHERVKRELQVLFLRNNVPLPLRKIIAGLLNPYPQSRMAMAEVLALLHDLPPVEKSTIKALFNELNMGGKTKTKDEITQEPPIDDSILEEKSSCPGF